MKKPNDYFVVSGISTDTIVESVHVITRSSPIEGARALLAGNNDASIEASENKVNPSHCPGDEGWVIGDRVEEQDVADDKAAARKVSYSCSHSDHAATTKSSHDIVVISSNSEQTGNRRSRII
jgi:hypothetical protein